MINWVEYFESFEGGLLKKYNTNEHEFNSYIRYWHCSQQKS